MRFHCATVLVVLSICAFRGNIADDAMQMDDKSLYPFYTTKEMPHFTVIITKNASLAAVAMYISISTNLHSRLSGDFQHRAFLFK